jgi:hypothetical protein
LSHISIPSFLQFVNEARRKAEAFGDTELIGPHAYDEGGDAGVIAGWDGERRDDLVLTTNARPAEKHEGDMDEMENRPRGFFADQVSLSDELSIPCADLLGYSSRTHPISRLTTTILDPRSGGRLEGSWMPL